MTTGIRSLGINVGSGRPAVVRAIRDGLSIAGVLLLLIVLFFPSGLMGWIYARFPRTQKVLE